jgi:preprotein translocase subunit YajC
MVQLILLQAASQGGGMFNLIFIGLMIGVFYFFMIRPQQKRAKEQDKFRNSLTAGDSVVTAGGLHAKVASVEEDGTVILLIGTVKMKFDKSSIAGPSTKLD